MNVKKKFGYRLLILLFVLVMALQIMGSSMLAQGQQTITEGVQQLTSAVKQFTDDVKVDIAKFVDPKVVYPLPSGLADDEPISVIVEMSTDSIMDEYNRGNGGETVGEFLNTKGGLDIVADADAMRSKLVTKLNKAGVKYTMGDTYDVMLSGFEIEILAGEFASVNVAIGEYANVIISDVFEMADAEVVTNDVNVYKTGIFDSSDCGFDGSGTVVAVLDSGFDYTHTAYSIDTFSSTELKFDQDYISGKIGDTVASTITNGLTVSDVYLNDRIPFSYDYADSDADVAPISSEHGTHVASIIGGKDDNITGVAPNTQLVLMKVFSDTRQGARQSWLLSALEDCVVLGVDVINMSLGSSCGFTREVDEEMTNEIYDSVGDAGISLVCAASNDYNSTKGSEKNGSLGLTSNPDSATVGSPSTYNSSLSVASVSGVKRAYLGYGDDKIMYYTEASTGGGKPKNFIKDLLPEDVDTQTFEYIVIPGIGASADYAGLDLTGKIALVKRGSNSFEDKANIAQSKGAAAILIYNNVSGDIGMSVGKASLAVASISQDNGEALVDLGNGTLTISRDQLAGPFMSDFSSWGPTPSLEIKPEITAHGGDIYAAVPGQEYDTLSGTSMASPNQAGIVALVRQYIYSNGSLSNEFTTPQQVTALANQLMMSTADVVYNTNGLAYAVRKQGAGVTNLNSIINTTGYVTIPSTGSQSIDGMLDKTKIEFGDDADKTGVYTATFAINNFGADSLTYDVGAIVMTEGVSETKTYKGETTVTEEGYYLDGDITVDSVDNGTQSNSKVTVLPSQTATVTVTITLSDEDKAYIDESFANGMYVEGFITLTNEDTEDVNLSIPYLAFYGDWTQAPVLDLDYFETDADAKDDSIDTLDKTLPDTFATTPLGGLNGDYISYLGSYYFATAPGVTDMTADRDHISLSNDANAVNSIYAIYAGMIRGAKTMEMTITDDATGEVIWSHNEYNVRKSYGASSIYPAFIDFDFSLLDFNLSNNSRYTFKMLAHLDYGDGGVDTNEKNTFEFTFTTDYQAPVVTDVNYTTEYDKDTKSYRTYAAFDVFDNHYSMGLSLGTLARDGDGITVNSFSDYVNPITSQLNSTSTVVVDITDYLTDMYADENLSNGCYLATVYDYAMNSAMYEIPLPTAIDTIEFKDKTTGEAVSSVILNTNELYYLEEALSLTPSTALVDLIKYESSDVTVARIVDGTVLGLNPGTATITATSPDGSVTTSFTVVVPGEDDEGYKPYDETVFSTFALRGYTTDKAYYFQYSGDRDIGLTDEYHLFYKGYYKLDMYPSEAVTLDCRINAYFPEDTTIKYTSSDSNIVNVDENGQIVAKAEGEASVTATVYLDGVKTFYTQRVTIEVKNPYDIMSGFLQSYKGLGGVVEIPDDMDVTHIAAYAFSGSKSEPKDLTVDEISDEDPYLSKTVAVGENTITKVVIPEGVEDIDAYAFANLTALEEVVLPSTLTYIAGGAFQGCTNLKRVVGLENVKFINDYAFAGCALVSNDAANGYQFKLDSAVAIGAYAFNNCTGLTEVTLPESAQSISTMAFSGCSGIHSLAINASKIKIGEGAFYGCASLTDLSINAQVISNNAFNGAASLTNVTLGRDVASIGANAFDGTNVSKFSINKWNNNLTTGDDGRLIIQMRTGSTVLVQVAPKYTKDTLTLSGVTTIVDNAFSSVSGLKNLVLEDVTSVGNYAFHKNTDIASVTFGQTGVSIGDYAFFGCASLKNINLANVDTIGDYAFGGWRAYTKQKYEAIDNYVWALGGINSPQFTTADLSHVTAIGEGAFMFNTALATVTLPSDLDVPNYAFAGCTALKTVNNLENTGNIGNYAFAGMTEYVAEKSGDEVTITVALYPTAIESIELGAVKVGDYAFSNSKLKTADLSQVTSVGKYAFSGYANGFLSELTNGTPVMIVEDSYLGQLTEVDLSSATYIGEGAFRYNSKLATIALSDELTRINDYAFAYTSISNGLDLTNMQYIGDYAFAGNTLCWLDDDYMVVDIAESYVQATAIDLSSATYIGNYAFAQSSRLAAVTFSANLQTIGNYAFTKNTALSAVVNLEQAQSIGDYAFYKTNISTADLTGAKHIGNFAFMDSNLHNVEISSDVTTIGENPFALCDISVIAVDGQEGDTFDFGTFSMVGNVLYGATANGGKVLITYPMSLEGDNYTVTDGTVRVGSYAFVGSDVVNVTLSSQLAAIGHMAFYDCKSLESVEFTSLYAPILEELFEENRANKENCLASGDVYYIDDNGDKAVVENEGVFQFDTWYMSNAQALYGATFVNYAQNGTSLSITRPVNGIDYDKWIYTRYFDMENVADGDAAWHKNTLHAKQLIEALPSLDDIVLADKDQINEAYSAYLAVPGEGQLVLIPDEIATVQAAYGKLTVLIFDELVDLIPEIKDITLANADTIVNALKAYKTANNNGQTVGKDSYDYMIKAEGAAIAIVTEVVNKIPATSDITLGDADVIAQARTIYTEAVAVGLNVPSAVVSKIALAENKLKALSSGDNENTDDPSDPTGPSEPTGPAEPTKPEGLSALVIVLIAVGGVLVVGGGVMAVVVLKKKKTTAVDDNENK